MLEVALRFAEARPALHERNAERAHAGTVAGVRSGLKRMRPSTPILIAAGALAVAAWIGFQALTRPRPQPVAQAAEHPELQLEPRAALLRAIELNGAGLQRESLPYFRRAAAVGSGWLVHWNYSAALNNLSVASSRDGDATQASRSSVERVELGCAAMAELRLAEQQAPDAHIHAMLQLVRGQTLEWWGLRAEALEAYREALANEPGWARVRAAEAACRASLGVAGLDRH